MCVADEGRSKQRILPKWGLNNAKANVHEAGQLLEIDNLNEASILHNDLNEEIYME